MARVVKEVVESVRKAKFQLDKSIVTMRCDDGTKYIFERPLDQPEAYSFARREYPDGSWSSAPGRLPASVKEHAEEVLPGWTK